MPKLHELYLRGFYAAMLAACIGCSAATGDEVLSVYVIPFQIQTYVPITRESIMCSAHEKWTVDSSKAPTLIDALKEGPAARFDDKLVRVAIAGAGETIFLDANGVVSGLGPARRVERESLTRVLTSVGKKSTVYSRGCK